MPARSKEKPPAAEGTPTKRARGRPKSVPGEDNASVGPEALIELTCKLLDEMPPGEVTRATIARAGNVHPALIRYYFRNRATLLRTAAEELTGQLQRLNSSGTADSPTSALTWVTRRVSNLFRFKNRHPYYHRLMMEEMGASEDPETRTFFQTRNRAIEVLYRETIDTGVAAGEVRKVDPIFLYIAIIGMCDMFVTGGNLLSALGIDRDDAETQRAYEDFMVEMTERMLRPD